MSKQIILVRYGEISLKGLNRNYFIDLLIKNIRKTLGYLDGVKVQKVQGRIIIHVDNQNLSEAMDSVSRVFGIVSFSPAVVVESNLEIIENAVLEEAQKRTFNTFRVTARRADKRFPMQSPEIGRHMGAVILRNIQDISVDMNNAEMNLWVEVREETYIYSQFIPGRGGLPVGCSGKSALLLSGGIDSPVAGYMMAKRGIQPICVYFHSFPFTSDRAKEKVVDLGKQLAKYTGRIELYVVPFTEIQTKIVEICPERLTTIIMRRYMMKIAEQIARINHANSLITGESLGQVASQTQEGLLCTNAIVNLPVLRPLIGMDKQEIVEIAQDIGTFETSILPYEDCCTIFVPKHPETKPKLEAVEKGEAKLELVIEPMIQKSIDDSEIIRL